MCGVTIDASQGSIARPPYFGADKDHRQTGPTHPHRSTLKWDSSFGELITVQSVQQNPSEIAITSFTLHHAYVVFHRQICTILLRNT